MPDEYTGPFAAKTDTKLMGFEDFLGPVFDPQKQNEAAVEAAALEKKLKDMNDGFGIKAMEAFVLGGEKGAKAFAEQANKQIDAVEQRLAELEKIAPKYGPPHPDDDPSAPPDWNKDDSDDSSGN